MVVEPLPGTWSMVVIGPGPGPKNVLARRAEDGAMTVVPYSRWKRELSQGAENVHSPNINHESLEVPVDLQVSIMQVAVRTTRNGRQLFDVSCSDGKTRAVWDAGLANAINAYAGSGATITIRVKVSQNGQYTNESITAFAPPGQALPADTGGTGGGGFQRGGGRGMTDEDKTRIAKMGAQGAAATIVAALFTSAGPEAYDEAVALHEQLTRKLYVEARSHEKPAEQQGATVLQPGAQVGAGDAQQGQILPQAGATPQTIAAGIPGVQVGAQVLQPGQAADPQAATDVAAQQASEQGDQIEWN